MKTVQETVLGAREETAACSKRRSAKRSAGEHEGRHLIVPDRTDIGRPRRFAQARAAERGRVRLDESLLSQSEGIATALAPSRWPMPWRMNSCIRFQGLRHDQRPAAWWRELETASTSRVRDLADSVKKLGALEPKSAAISPSFAARTARLRRQRRSQARRRLENELRQAENAERGNQELKPC